MGQAEQWFVEWLVARAIAASNASLKEHMEGRADRAAQLQAEAMHLMHAASDLRVELEAAEGSGEHMGVKVDIGQGDYLQSLKERMQKSGISAADLARASGVSPSQISRWFRTQTRPNMSNVERIELAMQRLSRRGKTSPKT